MKITEIFDVHNSEGNLILDQNTCILIHDYENYKIRLQDHSAILELLTRRVLNLSLFKNDFQKLKTSKLSFITKNNKSKQLQKDKIKGLMSSELLVIKKLLMVNLRSFKIMQQLLQENKELQILLNESNVFAKRQKQKGKYAKKENESWKEIEVRLKKRLGSFLHQLNRVSKSFLASFNNDYQDDSGYKCVLMHDNGEDNSQSLKLAFNVTNSGAYRPPVNTNTLLKIINNVHQELLFDDNLDVVVNNLRIRLISESISNFSFECMYVDRGIKYLLLTWNTEDHNEKSDLKDLKSNKCSYRIDKDIQNAIRLRSLNSSIWKSFLLMKTIQEFVIFNQVYELVKAFLFAAKTCGSDTTSKTNNTMFFQLKNCNPCLFLSKSTNQSSFTLNEMTEEVANERTKKYPKKHFQKTKVFYSLKHTHKKVINGTSNKKKPRKRISNESFSITETISIGIGDNYIKSVDRECQIDNDIFVEPTYETFENNFVEKNSSLTTLFNGHRDFKKSLKSLEDVIKSCQQKTRPETAIMSKKKKFIGAEKKVNTQHTVDTKLKEVKTRNRNDDRNPLDFYKKANHKNSILPEMSKMYQIILENRLPRGISFEYLTPDKSKVQLLFVSNSQDPHRRML